MKISAATWTPDAAEKLIPALLDEADEVAAQVQQGIAQLWAINGGESYMVTRIDRLLNRKPDFVVCCFAGKGGLKDLLPLLRNAAEAKGCGAILYPTHKPGMVRGGEQLGFKVKSTLMELKL